MSFDLSGKNVLITGAARGIGLAIGRLLAAHGARIVIHDYDQAALDEAMASLTGAGHVAFPVLADITDPDAAERVHAETVALLGDPHVLINNAGVQNRKPWLEAPAEHRDWHWRGNVSAPWELTRLCAPAMQAAAWGRVINVSSIQGRHGSPGMLAYGMSKAAIDHFTRLIAKDLGRYNITVNAIAPGIIDTARNEKFLTSDEKKKSEGARLPLRRVGEPEDIAGLALFLASDAASYITGQVIYVDGGMGL